MNLTYRNRNRGYQKLRVWQDSVDLYPLSARRRHTKEMQ